MSDPRDEHAPDETQHEDWLTHLAGPDRPAAGSARGSLRDRGHGLRGGLRQRQAPAPSLDAARIRSPRSIVPPKPAPVAPEPEEVEEFEEPEAPTAVKATPVKATPVKATAVKAPPATRRSMPLAEAPSRLPRAPKLPALPRVSINAEDIKRLAARRPAFHRPTLHRPHWHLSRRQTAGLGLGLAGMIVVAGSMVALLPGKPVVNPGTGAVNAVQFSTAAHPPTGTFNFGPYFVATEGRLLMMGSDGTTSFVWASSDGSNWEKLTSDDAFAAAGGRFVALGFASDGNGGFVAVGDSFAKDSTVSASAWYSRDGKKWFQAGIDFPQNAEMMGLAVGSDAMVAAGNGVAWISRGGTSWKMVALPQATGYVPRSVLTWAGGFAIVSAWAGDGDRKSAVWVSPDGETWLQAWQELALFDVEDAAPYGSGIVAVGSQAYTVDELATPTPKPTPTPKTTGQPKVTAKPTKTPAPTPAASGSATASGEPSASPGPTGAAIALRSAGSWSSANGLQWFRGNSTGGAYAQSMTSVSQVFDSLVAVGATPELTVEGASPSGSLTLWITDDGTGWKPVRTNVPPVARGRVVQYGSYVVVAGEAAGGSLAVFTGEVSLGSPLPPVSSTPTPAIAFSLRADESPAVPAGKATDLLGPVVGTSDRFYAFITTAAGTGVWTSTDGRAWTQQAEPADLLPVDGKGTPVVLAAIEDGRGGIMAVGKVTSADGKDGAMIWRFSGGKWSQATVTGTAPAALSSVSQHGGTFVAGATTTDGPRLMVSEDGSAWVAASVPGAGGYLLTGTSWAQGFIASGAGTPAGEGEDAASASASASATPGPFRVWTSPDGLVWTAQADWSLPRNAGTVVGAGDGLVATSTGITGKDSWWWSADGKTWQESQLTTVPGGCLASLDAGLVKVAPPAAGATDPAWSVWVSKDGKSWQSPNVDNVTFGSGTVCRVAAVGRKIVIVGWEAPGVLKFFYSH
jgi:hypothetical protein